MAPGAPFRKTLNLPKTSFPLQAKEHSAKVSVGPSEVASHQACHHICELPMDLGRDTFHTLMINRVLKDIFVRAHRHLSHPAKVSPLWAQRENEKLVPWLERLALMAPPFPWPHTESPQFVEKLQSLFQGWEAQGKVYRAAKPVPWSTRLKKVLEKREIEFRDHLWSSFYVKFTLTPESIESLGLPAPGPVHLLVWAPSPWNLPAVTGLAVRGNFSYVGAKLEDETFIFAEGLIDQIRKSLNLGEDRLSERIEGDQLTQCRAKHPLTQATLPIISTDRISLEWGSGILPLAPGMERMDFEASRGHDLPILCPVDESGRFDANCPLPDLIGTELFSQNEVIEEALRKVGAFIQMEEHTHPYPYCKSSQTPVVYRALPRLYFALDAEDTRSRAIDELRRISWRSDSEKDRLIEDLKELKDPPLSLSAGEGIPIQGHPGEFFSSWPIQMAATQQDLPEKLDGELFLESRGRGTHFLRYWLIDRLTDAKRPPLPLVLLHGTATEDASAFSDLIQKYFTETGLEAWRLWVASSDLYKDFFLTDVAANQIQNTYQKFRRTLRYLLGNLTHFKAGEANVPFENREAIDQWILAEFETQKDLLVQSYREMRLHHVYQRLHQWISGPLSSFYLEVVKDRLYFSQAQDPKRASTQATLLDILKGLLHVTEPCLPKMCHEAEKHLIDDFGVAPFLNQSTWRPQPNRRVSKEVATEMDKIRILRGEVFKALEHARKNKIIKHPRQAQVRLTAESDWLKFLQDKALQWANYFRVSQVVVSYELSIRAWKSVKLKGLQIEVVRAEGPACARCRFHSTTVGKTSAFPNLCQRCAQVLKKLNNSGSSTIAN